MAWTASIIVGAHLEEPPGRGQVGAAPCRRSCDRPRTPGRWRPGSRRARRCSPTSRSASVSSTITSSGERVALLRPVQGDRGDGVVPLHEQVLVRHAAIVALPLLLGRRAAPARRRPVRSRRADVRVRSPLAPDPGGCHHRGGDRGLRAVLPGRPEQGRPLRRVVLHRGHLHRHLLPAELPGHHPEAGQRPLLPDRGRGAAGRLPGLQAVPARRRARLARVERAGRRRGPGDAPDRRRRRRPGRRARARRAARLQRAPPAPPAASPRSAPGRSPWPGRSGRRPPGCSSRRRTSRSRRWRSPPASPASASSTTPCGRSSRRRPPRCDRRRAGGAARGPPRPGAARVRPASWRCASRSASPSTATPCCPSSVAGPSPASRSVAGDTYRRTLRLPHGPAVVELAPRPDHVACRLRLDRSP